MSDFFTLKYKTGSLIILDQTQLPEKIVYLRLNDYQVVIDAIKQLKIRGAPYIGIAGAYGLVLASIKNPARAYLINAADRIKSARPTAVNLSWAIERMLLIINNQHLSESNLNKTLLSEAKKIEKQETENSYRIGKTGARLIKNNMTIMTICNSGRLAAPGFGTALSVIYTAHKQGKKINVYVLETRPLLQGARLTAFELCNAKIPYTLITDNMMATAMKKVDLVLVGADRIARNGDTANKIGTLTSAITANYFQVPFYVVAPTSTIDLSKKTGKEIIIEERDKNEILRINNKYIAPPKSNAFNPAFDVTPHKLIAGIITEKGIIYPPYNKTVKNIINDNV